MALLGRSVTATMMNLEQYGVTLQDVTGIRKSNSGDQTFRDVLITIPYEALRDEKAVQLAFQDLVVISTTP